MRKIYFTEEARREAKRLKDQSFRAANRGEINARRRELRGAPIKGRYNVLIHNQFDDEVRPPPEVLAAQQRLFEWMWRAVEQGRVTPSQYWIGEPSSGRSLSATQIQAMLG